MNRRISTGDLCKLKVNTFLVSEGHKTLATGEYAGMRGLDAGESGGHSTIFATSLNFFDD